MATEKRFPFNKRRIESLPVPRAGRAEYRDERVPGLTLRVTPTGVRTFTFYRKVQGRPVRVTIGRFPETSVEQARRQAGRLQGLAASGIDPAAARRAGRNEPTLHDLFTHWLENYAKPTKRTWAEDERKFKKHLCHWKNRQLSSIGGAEVLAWHRHLGRECGPYLANRARALLSAMFTKAAEIGYLGPNPCAAVSKFREESRTRFLQPSEMAGFFVALAAEQPQWRDFFLLCLLTGARRGNVASMAWREIDLDAGVWTIAGERAKGGEPLTVVLSEPARSVLETRQRNQQDSCPWVFPAKTKEGHVVDPRRAWHRVRNRSGLADLRMHDLRRSLGSWQAATGASLPVIGATLGHRDPKATTVYARLHVDPIRESVQRAADAMFNAAGVRLLEELRDVVLREELRQPLLLPLAADDRRRIGLR